MMDNSGSCKTFLGTGDYPKFMNEAKEELVDDVAGLDGYSESVVDEFQFVKYFVVVIRGLTNRVEGTVDVAVGDDGGAKVFKQHNATPSLRLS